MVVPLPDTCLSVNWVIVRTLCDFSDISNYLGIVHIFLKLERPYLLFCLDMQRFPILIKMKMRDVKSD